MPISSCTMQNSKQRLIFIQLLYFRGNFRHLYQIYTPPLKSLSYVIFSFGRFSRSSQIERILTPGQRHLREAGGKSEQSKIETVEGTLLKCDQN